jgi:hypothetical protein
MTTRRSVLRAAAAGAGLSAASGCFGFATGTAPLEDEAREVTVADGALADTGYEVYRSEPVVERYTVRIADQPREIEATSHVSEYRKLLSMGMMDEEEYLGVVGVISAPRTEVIGRTFHPLEERTDRRLVGDLQSQYDEFEDSQLVEPEGVTVLDERREVDVYRARTERAGESIDAMINLLSFAFDGDQLAAVGVYPASLSGEKQRIHTLFEHVQHG